MSKQPGLEAKGAARLRAFLETEMSMSHIYQPVMIRTILDGGGAATRRQIAAAISAADLSQLEYYEKVVTRYPGPVLRKRKIVEFVDGVYKLSNEIGRLDEWERATLRAICEARVADFVAERQHRIWAHRAGNSDPLPGSLRWQIISRAFGRCEACGVSSAERALEVDHIKPRSHGGSNELSNLQALCSLCNVQKLDREAIDFRGAHRAAAARRAGCGVCDASSVESMENELAKVVVIDGVLLVSPKRHGVSYIELWQSEINAVRQLERALAEQGFDWSSMVSAMRFRLASDAGHLAITSVAGGDR